MKITGLLTISFCLFVFSHAALADPLTLPDRRKPQFQKEHGYYVFPTPYSVPGVGSGAAIIGIGMNMWNSYTDVFGFALAGGLQGGGLGLIDVHLVPEHLILDVNAEDLNKATLTSFQGRGMETGEHDFSLLEMSNFQFAGARLTSTFFDRRFEVYGGGYRIHSKLEKILNNEGNTILDIEAPPTSRTSVYGLGVRTDFTDDYADPRRGIRLDVSRWWSPPQRRSDPDFFRIEYNATAYVPIGKRSAWAFNYFRTDAHVDRPGATDRDVIAEEQGLNCAAIADPDQRAECERETQQVIDNIIAANTFGTVSSFGGTSRLRSFPNDRFSGAHAVFYGTEIRWTLTEEAYPFDIFIAKDIRTLLQVAAFYELGSIADRRDDLGDIYRASYGAGFRMVTASGLVLRADVAAGKEGLEVTIIFGYPWESF